MATLMQEIRAFAVDKGSVAMWWLGQNGYIFKTPEGTLLSTDMYLTNNCAHVYRDSGVDLERRVPILIAPEELNVDIYACTHNHLDHTDPVPIGGVARKDTAHFYRAPPDGELEGRQSGETRRTLPPSPGWQFESKDVT